MIHATSITKFYLTVYYCLTFINTNVFYLLPFKFSRWLVKVMAFSFNLISVFFSTKKSVSSQYTLTNRHYSSENFVKKIRIDKRSLKIPKGGNQNHRRTDNTMAKSKSDKKTNNDLQNSTQNNNTNPSRNWGWTHILRKGRQFMLHKWHPSCFSSSKPGSVVELVIKLTRWLALIT